MPFAGKRLLQRTAAGYIADRWQNQNERIKGLATAQAESWLYVGAYGDNISATGEIKSRDCGIFQINIDGDQVGEEQEAKLRTESLDFEVYDEVVKYNVTRAKSLYDNAWIRDGEQDIRRWQPWVAYTSGWAMFKPWWVWKHVRAVPTDPKTLVPVGPWVATGRYLAKSIMGWANWYLVEAKLKDAEQALAWAVDKQNLYKVEGELGIKWSKSSNMNSIAWIDYPDKPVDPPADGVGPRPKTNNGK